MTTEASAPPALFDHCVNTYRAMMEEARNVAAPPLPEDVSDLGDTDDYAGAGSDELRSIVVYEGFFTRLVTTNLNLSVPYFTSIRRKLVDMGCIRQLKRGGGTSPSQWELIYEPTLEAFMRETPQKKTKAQTRDAMVDEQLTECRKRLTDLESTMESVLEVLGREFGSEKQ